MCGAALRALSFPAEEQTGKDGRGYVSTAIKMTVESERWAQGGGGAAVAWGVGHKNNLGWGGGVLKESLPPPLPHGHLHLHFCRDQTPHSTAGGGPEAAQPPLFALPVLQPELQPENLLNPIW